VTRIVRLGTMTCRFAAATHDSCDRPRTKVTEISELPQQVETVLFEIGKGFGNGCSSLYVHYTFRPNAPKKETPYFSTSMSRTRMSPHLLPSIALNVFLSK
jgi:hypothetical protein